jgi:hypothetical protein
LKQSAGEFAIARSIPPPKQRFATFQESHLKESAASNMIIMA